MEGRHAPLSIACYYRFGRDDSWGLDQGPTVTSDGCVHQMGTSRSRGSLVICLLIFVVSFRWASLRTHSAPSTNSRLCSITQGQTAAKYSITDLGLLPGGGSASASSI